MSEPMTATEPLVDPAAVLTTPPRTIGRFSVLNEIGRGSNGVVYAAHDPVLSREVAIKVIPLTDDTTFRARIEASFLQEAKFAGGMSHPHIVMVFDAGKTDELAYIAMERLHGQDLHEFMAAGNRLSPRQAASMIARAADAIHYANKRGLVHRDIKPSNIFLSRDLKPKVLDFGVALHPVISPDKAGARQLIGTPNYMSPEQAAGHTLDARSDIFSLGSILYELLAGRRAFDGASVDDTLTQVMNCAPLPLAEVRPELPSALIAIVERAMARNPEQRYQKAAELRNDLNEFAEATRASAQGAAADKPAWQPAHTSGARPGRMPFAGADWRRVTVGACAVLVAFTVLMIGLNRGHRDSVIASAPSPEPMTASPAPVLVPPPPADAKDAAIEQALVESRKASEVKLAAAKRRVEAPAQVAAAAPPRNGIVTLAVSPWGEIVVDGTSRGVSPPLTQLALPPGQHTVEIRNGDAPAFVARVEVRPGESMSLQHRF